MSKATDIDIQILIEILGKHLDTEKRTDIIRDINKALKEEEEEENKEGAEDGEEKPPKVVKKPMVIVTSLPAGVTEEHLTEIVGFFTMVAEDSPGREIKGALKECMAEYNGTKKAKKNPADSLGDLFEIAPLKIFKENKIYAKPKGPLDIIYCPNVPR